MTQSHGFSWKEQTENTSPGHCPHWSCLLSWVEGGGPKLPGAQGPALQGQATMESCPQPEKSRITFIRCSLMQGGPVQCGSPTPFQVSEPLGEITVSPLLIMVLKRAPAPFPTGIRTNAVGRGGEGAPPPPGHGPSLPGALTALCWDCDPRTWLWPWVQPRSFSSPPEVLPT